MRLRSHMPYPRLQVELNEARMDAKIDMLHRSGMIGQASNKVEKQSGGDSTRVAGLEEVSRMCLCKGLPCELFAFTTD